VGREKWKQFVLRTEVKGVNAPACTQCCKTLNKVQLIKKRNKKTAPHYLIASCFAISRSYTGRLVANSAINIHSAAAAKNSCDYVI